MTNKLKYFQFVNFYREKNIGTVLLRLSVIFIFALFGSHKWFSFAVNDLNLLLPNPWLGFLYPAIGLSTQGLSYILGFIEYVTFLFLFLFLFFGIFRPVAGVIGDLMTISTGLITLSLLPQLGRLDSFIIKDVLLVGAGAALLQYDLTRWVCSIRPKVND